MDPSTLFASLAAMVPARDLIYLAALCGVCAAVMPWLPVPKVAASPYGRLYAALNLLAQNFRNVTNATKPGDISK